MGRPLNRSVAIAAAAAVCIRLLFGTVPARGEGFLERLRQTVRIPPLASPSQAPNEKPEKVVVEHHHYHHYYGRDDDDDEGLSDLYALGFIAAGLAASSPWWGPHMLLGDDFDSGGFFPRFPYDDVPGYMMIGPKDEAGEPGSGNGKSAGGIGLQQPWPVPPRRVAVRFATEYAGDMGDVERLAGRLLLSTSSRWEFDTGFHYFEEVLAAGGRDQLWLGDFNVVLRFAQHEHVQFRSGLGLNWLDDPGPAKLGFNFTYGADFFPRRPWVISTALDWGTLGHSELFRLRATAGVVLHGVEVYSGYEYLDVDAETFNGLIAGVRLWF